MLFTSKDNKLLFLDNSNFVQIHDRFTLEPNKILKIGDSTIKAVDKLKEDIFILGCSHGNMIVYNESYSRSIQRFEAHNDSVLNIIVNSKKVYNIIL